MENALRRRLDTIMPTGLIGSVVRTEGVAVGVAGLPAPVGSVVAIERHAGNGVEAEVIGFHDGLAWVYPFGELSGVRHGNRVVLKRTCRRIPVCEGLLGRIIDAHGRPIDGKPAPTAALHAPLHRDPPPAVERPRIHTPLTTGIRAIDAFLTCGFGQRIGIFAGSGIGKSVLLGMIAQHATADVIVIGLVGERGREVNEFVERDLGPKGLARSVVVVATSDQPALCRVQSAMTATAIAESFRDKGKNVLLIMDSLTRFAMAQREIGLAAGEPPTTKGYPPSVFAMLPKLVERAGLSQKGSITAIYSVLVEGDDNNEPVADAVRGLLDGHTVLSRQLANQAHYPAIDVLESISRLMPEITPPEVWESANFLRSVLAAYRENEDLIQIGAYRNGSNPLVDTAIALRPTLQQFLRQKPTGDFTRLEEAHQAIIQLAQQVTVSQQNPQTPSVQSIAKQ